MSSSYDDIPTLGTSTQSQHTYSGHKSFDVVGYTHSDGYALCEKHAEYGDMPDPGNESGKVQAIFEGDETDSDILCDMCYTIAFSQGLHGTALRDACLIQGKNIWYAKEVYQIAHDVLNDMPVWHGESYRKWKMGLYDEGIGSDTFHLWQHCLTCSLMLLEKKGVVDDWYTAMNDLITRLYTVTAIPETILDTVATVYAEIKDDVQEHIRSITEQ